MDEIEYYSQCGQDKTVVELFRGMKYGYFIELGAADGIYISNTYTLEKFFEWEGLCVEPHTLNFEKLKNNRNCTIDNNFVLDDGSMVDYIQYEDMGHKESLFSSMIPYPSYTNTKKNSILKLKTVSLLNLLNKYHSPNMIHYMSLDMDGSEYIVLKNFFENNSKFKNGEKIYNILSISVEHNFLEPNRSNIKKLLNENGFIFHKQIEQDDFYINRAIEGLI
jgi:FkbM family methyltransferase